MEPVKRPPLNFQVGDFEVRVCSPSRHGVQDALGKACRSPGDQLTAHQSNQGSGTAPNQDVSHVQCNKPTLQHFVFEGNGLCFEFLRVRCMFPFSLGLLASLVGPSS